MTYCFDLDGTLCTNTNGEYHLAQPFIERISVVNRLFNEGHQILVETARGSTTGIDWFDFTIKQLASWGVFYTALRVGIKAQADIFIDDKGISDRDFFKQNGVI